MSEDVDWPHGDARLHGLASVKNYWSLLWNRFHVHDEVVGVADVGPERPAVRVREVVRDLGGEIVSTGAFEHAYTFSDGLVQRMDLRDCNPNLRSKMMNGDSDLVRALYAAFNIRDVSAAVALMDLEVDWANGQNGGHVHGREAVRSYWTKQWAAIQPRVDPLDMSRRTDGVTAVEVHQVVHDFGGKLLLDERVRHVFRIRDGLVVRFDIENAGGLSTLGHD